MSLPEELLCITFSFLPPREIILSIPHVSKHWKNIITSAPKELAIVVNPAIEALAREACQNGCLHTLQTLSHFNLAYDYAMLAVSCRNGHLKVVQWLASQFKLTANDVRVYDNLALLSACERGHLQVAQWLIPHFNLAADIHICENYAFRYSCYNGHLKLAQWLASRFNINRDNAHADIRCALIINYTHGHLHVAKWLTTHFNLTAKDARARNNLAFSKSCANGHSHVTQWLASHFNLTADARDNNNATVATYNGLHPSIYK